LTKELKQTCYNPIVAILGSRDQLCVNKELNDVYGSEKNTQCNLLVKASACHYFQNLEKFGSKVVKTYKKQRKVMDIEDLVSFSKNSILRPFLAFSADFDRFFGHKSPNFFLKISQLSYQKASF
jgi:regulator of telomere elongation helicase 1